MNFHKTLQMAGLDTNSHIPRKNQKVMRASQRNEHLKSTKSVRIQKVCIFLNISAFGALKSIVYIVCFLSLLSLDFHETLEVTDFDAESHIL